MSERIPLPRPVVALREVAMAIGLDPDEHHVRSIDVHASVEGPPTVAVKMFMDVEGLGRFVEVVKRYRMVEQEVRADGPTEYRAILAIRSYPADSFVSDIVTTSYHTCPRSGCNHEPAPCFATLSPDRPYTHVVLHCQSCRADWEQAAADVEIPFASAPAIDIGATAKARDPVAPPCPGCGERLAMAAGCTGGLPYLSLACRECAIISEQSGTQSDSFQDLERNALADLGKKVERRRAKTVQLSEYDLAKLASIFSMDPTKIADAPTSDSMPLADIYGTINLGGWSVKAMKPDAASEPDQPQSWREQPPML